MWKSRAPADHSKVLDLDEAERLLPLVRTLVDRIERRVALRRRLELQMSVLQLLCDMAAELGADFQEFVDKKIRYHRLGGQIDALAERLGALGVVVRDRDASYADFTCLRDDGLAVFCWRRGEGRIGHWHFMHERHTARRRLPRQRG
jgi:hypothetical protein